MSDHDNLREWEHNHETTEHFAFTGGTEMTSQDELRDRIAEIVNAALVAWNTDMDTQDSEGEYVAQAIIDELGLTNEWSFRFEGKDRRYSLNRAEDLRTIGLYGPLEDAAIESRVVGKWVEQ